MLKIPAELIGNLPWSQLTGAASTSQIPNLSADKITSGVLGVDRIPNLPASKITDLPDASVPAGLLTAFVQKTGDSAERISSMPLDQVRRSILVLGASYQAGDILIINGSQEFTNASSNNIMVATQLMLNQNINGNTGTEITEMSSRNISVDMHHDTFPSNGVMVIPSTGTWYVHYMAYAAASGTSTPIVVEQDYGWLHIVRLRAAT
jgi:hypothetical protein